MPASPISTNRIFTGITLVWLLITGLSGWGLFYVQGNAPGFHPYWAMISVGPLLLLQFFWIRWQRRAGESSKELIYGRILTALGLLAALLTGLGAFMGFLPFFFHQVIVWPLALWLAWNLTSLLFKS